MRADIHYGQEHQSSTHGPDTDVQDQYPSVAHIGLATHGRSIQIGSSKAVFEFERRDRQAVYEQPDIERVHRLVEAVAQLPGYAKAVGSVSLFSLGIARRGRAVK